MAKQPTAKRLELMRLTNAELKLQGMSDAEIKELRSEQQAAAPDRVQVYAVPPAVANAIRASAGAEGDVVEGNVTPAAPAADTAPTPTARRSDRT